MCLCVCTLWNASKALVTLDDHSFFRWIFVHHMQVGPSKGGWLFPHTDNSTPELPLLIGMERSVTVELERMRQIPTERPLTLSNVWHLYFVIATVTSVFHGRKAIFICLALGEASLHYFINQCCNINCWLDLVFQKCAYERSLIYRHTYHSGKNLSCPPLPNITVKSNKIPKAQIKLP